MNDNKSKKLNESSQPEASEQGLSRRDMIKGAVAVGIGAVSLGASDSVKAAEVTTAAKKKTSSKTLSDLIRNMAEDHNFAEAVIRDPRAYKEEYNLSPKAIHALKGLFVEDFAALAGKIGDPKSFAAGVITAASISRGQFKVESSFEGSSVNVEVDNDDIDNCYYFG
ncbi:MAG: hypothetical protein JNN15_10225 [Blastocatellia bacterium]|nr:hypothetical protein [Blastocatellia bacterium]